MELNLEKYEIMIYRIFPSRNSRHFEILDLERGEPIRNRSGHVTFIFRVAGIELGKIRNYYFIVFFQVGISDTSKYSTWKEKNGEPIREEDYFCPFRELYFEIWN